MKRNSNTFQQSDLERNAYHTSLDMRIQTQSMISMTLQPQLEATAHNTGKQKTTAKKLKKQQNSCSTNLQCLY